MGMQPMILLQNSRLIKLYSQMICSLLRTAYNTCQIIKSQANYMYLIISYIISLQLNFKTLIQLSPFMLFIEQLQQYFVFTKQQIFDHLHAAVTDQIAFSITNHHAHNRNINNIQMHIENINKQRTNYKYFGQHIDVFTDMFTCYMVSLQVEHKRSKDVIDRLQSQILVKIEQCESTFLDIQKRILAYGKQEIQKLNNDIQFYENKIKENQVGIQAQKKKCFNRLMQFAQQQNEQNIKIKFKTEDNFENMKKYGKINSQMHGFFQDSIAIFQENIFDQLRNINQVEKEKEQLFQKISVVFSQAQEEKIGIAQNFSQLFNQCFQKKEVILSKIPYSANLVEIPKKGVIPNLKYLKTAVDLCLHPHPHNQVIIAHRQSLQNSLTYDISCFEIQLSENFQIDTSNMTVQDKQTKKYQLCKIFIAEIRDAYQNCQKQVHLNYFQKLTDLMRNKGYRELFVFFMHQICKISKHQKPVNSKQEEFISNTAKICLRKCQTCFDGQTALKIILLSFHLKTVSSSYFASKLYLTPFIENFQFWSAILIENIYEYCEMIVIYYHNKLQQMKQEYHNQAQRHSFWGFLKPIQNLFKQNQQKIEVVDQIKSIYHQIIKNVFTFQICLMRLIHVSKEVQKKLIDYINEAVQLLKFSPQIQANLKKCLQIIIAKEQEKLLQLIRSELILQRSLSKLFGVKSDQKELDQKHQFSISQMINNWYKIE